MAEMQTQQQNMSGEFIIPNPLGDEVVSEESQKTDTPENIVLQPSTVEPPQEISSSTPQIPQTPDIQPPATEVQKSLEVEPPTPPSVWVFSGIKLKIQTPWETQDTSNQISPSTLPASDGPKIKLSSIQALWTPPVAPTEKAPENTQEVEKTPTSEPNKIHIGMFQTWTLTQMSSMAWDKKHEEEKEEKKEQEKQALELEAEQKGAKKSGVHELFKNYQPSFLKKKPTVMEQLNKAKRVVKTNFKFILFTVIMTGIGIYSLHFFNPTIHNLPNYRNSLVALYNKYTRHVLNMPATQPLMKWLLTSQSWADLYTDEPVEETWAVVEEVPVIDEAQLLVDANLAKDRFSLWPVPGSMDFIIASSQDFELQQQKLKEKQMALEEEQQKVKEREVARKSKINAFLNKNLTELPAVTLEEKRKTAEELIKEKQKQIEEERVNAKKQIVSGILNKYTFVLPWEEPKIDLTPKTPEEVKPNEVKPKNTEVAINTPTVNEKPKWGKTAEDIKKEKAAAALNDILNKNNTPKVTAGTWSTVTPKKPTKWELMVAAQKALAEKKALELKKKTGDILNKYTFTSPTSTGTNIKNPIELTSAKDEDPEKTKIRKEKVRTYLLKFFGTK